MTGQKNIVRRAVWPADAERIMEVFAAAKSIMRASGNLHQWNDNYPSMEVVKHDIECGGGYVVEEIDNTGDTHRNPLIVAYFAFLPSPEPTYSRIDGGEWLDDTLPYHVVHRIASTANSHGIFKTVMDFCFSHDPNIRIDTHRDNLIMQHNITKHGFTYCGIIYLDNGDERLAYQCIKSNS